MEYGTWNVAVIDFAVEENGVITCGHQEGEALGNRIFTLMRNEYGDDQTRRTPCIAGDDDERRAEAAAYAQSLNANVVIYGVIRLDEPIGQATFTPELYIHPAERDRVLYAEEILGQTTFGSPVQFDPITTSGPENEKIDRRLAALRHFVEGVRHYIVDNFDDARDQLQAALSELDGEGVAQASDDNQAEGDVHARAVVHEFLAATELSKGIWYEVDQGDTEQAILHYTQAISEAQRAHDLWPSYARPFLAKGSAMFSLALAQRPDGPLPASVDQLPLDHPVQCFGDEQDPSLTFQQMLRISWQCYADALEQYADALEQEEQVQEMVLDSKVRYTQGNMLVLWSQYSETKYWRAAWEHMDELINVYERANPEDQIRLRRIAAHAYARRGLVQAYYLPDRGCRDRLQQAAADYDMAIGLLVEPVPGGASCADNLDNCQEGDQRFIETYREQREILDNVIGQADITLPGCQDQ
jgi:tetratricopeptide (TPR) repeat protein